jgi:hypothetical protein
MAATEEAGEGASGGAKALQARVAASFGAEQGRIALPRDGLKPLAFAGQLLAEVSGCAPGSRLWYELAAYARDDGGYVAAINVFKKDIGAKDSRWARAFRTLDELCAYFEKHDPEGDVDAPADKAGRRLPEAEAMLNAAALRQRLSEARAEYDAAVGELLEALPRAA